MAVNSNPGTYNNSGAGSQFDRLGHPGRYTGCLTHTGGETYLTGSNYGYGAMMVGSGSFPINADCKVSLSGGGDLHLKEFRGSLSAVGESIGPIVEVSAYYVSSSTKSPNVYLFKRQQ
tara:strand:- start:518 stop:871 length:354 start_codon:yes stop_codon:yes gene_type:complete